jgi:hypothetical protein
MKAAALLACVPLAGCAGVWGFDDLTLSGDAAANPDAPGGETGSPVDSGSDLVSAEAATDAATDAVTDAVTDSGIEGSGDGASDCPGSFLLCDGFESASIDSTRWASPDCTAMTSMDIGTTAHRGSHSLHVHVSQITDTSYASCTLKTNMTSIFASTPMYFRAWLYPTANAGTAQSIVTALSTANGSASGSMGLDSTGAFRVGVANAAANNYVTSSTRTISTNAWTCIELEIDTNYATHPNGLLAAWDDTSGTADPQLAGTAELQPLFAALFGLSLNGPSAAVDLYLDDIAISNAYVPCSQ